MSRHPYVAPPDLTPTEFLRNYRRISPFVTTYARNRDKEHRFGELVVMAAQQMKGNMSIVSAEDMSKSLADSGKVVLYGI